MAWPWIWITPWNWQMLCSFLLWVSTNALKIKRAIIATSSQLWKDIICQHPTSLAQDQKRLFYPTLWNSHKFCMCLVLHTSGIILFIVICGFPLIILLQHVDMKGLNLCRCHFDFVVNATNFATLLTTVNGPRQDSVSLFRSVGNNSSTRSPCCNSLFLPRRL